MYGSLWIDERTYRARDVESAFAADFHAQDPLVKPFNHLFDSDMTYEVSVYVSYSCLLCNNYVSGMFGNHLTRPNTK